MGYPSKPWTNGQTAEIVPGELFQYDASQSVWIHLTKATLDSDYQVDKSAIESDISSLQSTTATNTSDISSLDTRVTAAESDITTLQSQVVSLGLLTDSDAARITANVNAINTAYSMLDSDSINIQSLRTDLQAEINATNSEISSIQSDVSTAQSDIVSNTNAINNLAMPVVSSTQPTGQAGLLWVNLNDGKLYYWDATQEVFTEVVSGA